MSPAPVFVLAAPYSGADVCAALLGQHPALCALPQLNLFLAPTVGELREIFRLSQGPAADGLLRALSQLQTGSQTDAGVATAGAWLQGLAADAPVSTILDELRARAAPRQLVIPDVETPLRLADIDRLLEQVPDARIVHLVRHPWSQGVVLQDRCAERLFVPVDFKDFSHTPPPVEPQIPWLRANRNLLDWVVAARPQASTTVRWEDLITDPHTALQPLCGRLGLAAATVDYAAYDRWTFWGHGPQTAPYGLDAEVLEAIDESVMDLAFAAPTLDQELPWRTDGSGFVGAVRALARDFGYR